MGNRKILVVDDESDMQIYVSTVVETMGFEPLVAGDGPEALKKAREFHPALVILDVMMPKIEDGLKTYRQFRVLAARENRPLSNFIETAALRYVETEQFVNEFEMEEIRGNTELNRSLKRGLKDAKAGRGRFV